MSPSSFLVNEVHDFLILNRNLLVFCHKMFDRFCLHNSTIAHFDVMSCQRSFQKIYISRSVVNTPSQIIRLSSLDFRMCLQIKIKTFVIVNSPYIFQIFFWFDFVSIFAFLSNIKDDEVNSFIKALDPLLCQIMQQCDNDNKMKKCKSEF